jgi:hypothetical protein
MPGKDSQDSEEQKLIDWLKTEGYSLQMRVARTLSLAGFDVSQFESYVDPNENKLREIDMLASVTREFDGFTVSVSFLIECKHAGEHQWVVFTSPRRIGRWFHFSRVLRDRSKMRDWQLYTTLQARLVARILASPAFGDTKNPSFFSVPQSLGNTVV